MSSDIADLEIIFKPNTDLAIQNYIAREIVARNAVNKAFVDKHCVFATGPYDIGYGMRATDKYAYAAEKDTQAKELKVTLDKYEAIGQRRQEGEVVEQKNTADPAKHWMISFEDFKKGVEPYTLDFVAELAKGDADESLDSFKAKLKQLADLYIEPSSKVVSFWTMGFNQHQRGTWVNEQCYMNHLLLGKQSMPGNGAFSLTGQPSACGTAREVGTFSHRLPADRLIPNPTHRAETEKYWNVPAKTINPKMGSFYAKILRDLEDGSVKWAWVQVNNPWHTHPNANHWIKAAREQDNFIVVSEAYPGDFRQGGRPHPARRDDLREVGRLRQRRASHPALAPAGAAARAGARRHLADAWSSSKRFKIKEFWGEQKLPGLKVEGYQDNTLPSVLADAQTMGYSPEDSLYKALFATPDNLKVKWPDRGRQGARQPCRQTAR